MQTKRQQSMADRKNQAASAKAEKAKIQENLLALEAFRRKQRSQDGAENEVSGDNGILLCLLGIFYETSSGCLARFRVY